MKNSATRLEDVARTRVRTLGHFEVVVDGTEIRRWRAGRARALFQFLLTEAGRPASKTTLIDAVWGNSAGRSPETSLKVAVYNLRAAISEAYGDRLPTSPALWITSYRGSYALSYAGAEVDVDELDRLLDAGAAAAAEGRLSLAAHHYRRAVDFYHGSYLPGTDEPWAVIRREQIKDRTLSALDSLASYARKTGEGIPLQELHRRMLDIDPCREESYRELMRWHAMAQQPSRVVHWYDTCARQLRAQLGVEPGRETRALFYRAVSGQLTGDAYPDAR